VLNASKEGRALLDDGPELVPKVDREESVFSWGRCGSRDKERTGEEVEEVRGVHHPLPRKCCQLDRIGRIPSRPAQFLEVSRDVLRDSNQNSFRSERTCSCKPPRPHPPKVSERACSPCRRTRCRRRRPGRVDLGKRSPPEGRDSASSGVCRSTAKWTERG
jgi:hypothetical protein